MKEIYTTSSQANSHSRPQQTRTCTDGKKKNQNRFHNKLIKCLLKNNHPIWFFFAVRRTTYKVHKAKVQSRKYVRMYLYKYICLAFP